MAFDPLYAPAVQAFLDALPTSLWKSVLKEIRRLADDPVLASAPPSGPVADEADVLL